MLNQRSLFVASVVLVSAVSCSAPEADRSARTRQSLEGPGEGGGVSGPIGACAHPICAPGVALAATCDPCATNVCALDPYCCQATWDTTCVGEVTSICGQSCTAPPPSNDAGASTCAHPVCATGAALVSSCEPCATSLCAQDPYCCAVEWDATCVGEVTAICGKACN